MLVIAAQAEDCAGKLDAAKAFAAQAGVSASVRRCVIAGQISVLTRAVRQTGAGVLVLDGDGRFRSSAGFATLLNEVDCPVILVG